MMTSKNLEKKIDYTFKDKKVFYEALTHKSFCILESRNKPHNERLEFLGDAVLGSVLAELLMEMFPHDDEGMLSKKRASLVNQSVLAVKARHLALYDYLILGPGEKEQESHLKPRVLASAYEALLGALYLDAGFSHIQAWIKSQFIEDIRVIKPDLEYEKDYKTRLQEIAQKDKLGTPVYKLISTDGPSHNPEFLVAISLGSDEKFKATGKSKKAAEQMAAQLLIQSLQKTNGKKA